MALPRPPNEVRHTFFVGPRKTGTTSLHQALEGSKLQSPANVKETFFFERPGCGLEEYERRFAVDPERPFLECSPSYFTSETAVENLSRLFPGARVVITLRDPVTRVLSAIQHSRRIGLLDERLTLDELIDKPWQIKGLNSLSAELSCRARHSV